MEAELLSEGKCLFCDEMVSQKTMGKHLATHLAKEEKEEKSKNAQTFCHIEVASGPMFLHLLVRGSDKMHVVDAYLRKIWLDCCGHMSAFRHQKFNISMNLKVEDVFSPRIKIQHDYDFGTTTTVFLKAQKEYQLALKGSVLLLSRNQPLKLLCATCKKEAATSLCSVCQWEDYSYFCDKCGEKHALTCEDFEDYANMPVVNSPRMGECGYTGGSIDRERDGCYQEK